MKKRGLGENSLLAFAGDGASKLSAFVVVIIAARFLSVREFAVLATGLAAASLLGSLLDLGAGTLLTRDGAKSRASRGALFASLLRARVPLAAAVLLGLLLGRPLAALAVAALGLSWALALSVLGLYRSCQDIRPEAIQKLAAGVLSVVAALLAPVVLPRADVLLMAFALIVLVTLAPLIRRTSALADFSARVRPLSALKSAAPIGLLALATVAYYRSGTLALALLADANETAVFGVAASIAFGMLMLPNAVTTALLPRLAAEDDLHGLVTCARRALVWTLGVAVLLSAAAAVVVPVGLPLVLGSRYAGAAAPFVLLCTGIPVIAASGVIGTCLLTVGRLRPLAVQVAVSLGVNLVVLALFVPVLGAVGAASATVACELVGFVLLAHISRRALPGLIALHPPRLRRPVQASGTATT
jgi:O-antigen/teichoic acid export membrane protein